MHESHPRVPRKPRKSVGNPPARHMTRLRGDLDVYSVRGHPHITLTAEDLQIKPLFEPSLLSHDLIPFCKYSPQAHSMVSTGRGGSGNLVAAESVGSDVISPKESKKDKPQYYSTGRGGAGNIKSSNEKQLPKLVPQGSNTPKLTTSKITTGRGGYGNMVDNSDPNLTRKLQDVDGNNQTENELCAVASNKSFSIGRGGFGNVVSKTRSNGSSSNATPNNLYTVISQGDKKDKKSGLIHKVKNLFN